MGKYGWILSEFGAAWVNIVKNGWVVGKYMDGFEWILG